MRTRSARLLCFGLAVAASPAAAEIRASAPNGFDVASAATVRAATAR